MLVRPRLSYAVSLRAGEAINPRNLSLLERLTGVGKEYNKQLDRDDLYDDQFQQSQQADGKTGEATNEA